jgi:hypothetical protein
MRTLPHAALASLPEAGAVLLRRLEGHLQRPGILFPFWDLDTCSQGLKGWAMDRVERLFLALGVIGFVGMIVSVIWILLS